ncbi:penicillin-binding transpeptidase domain-containing protein, partial [Salmonella enterica subsp. enterica serovar Kentucky]|nr:penicillin-binding transpeptidase domain-containing protein [Salmonella enterica subsp. enterica serovar Kentucky]
TIPVGIGQGYWTATPIQMSKALMILINDGVVKVPHLLMSTAEGLMGPFAITDPAAGTTGPWYTNGTFGLTAGWDLDLWGKNR